MTVEHIEFLVSAILGGLALGLVAALTDIKGRG